MFALIKNGIVEKFPYKFRDLRGDNPQTSFPRNMTLEQAKAYGVEKVVVGEKPEYNSRTHKITIQKTPSLDGERWVLRWNVEPLTQDEIEAIRSKLEANIRRKRNEKLAETDFIILKHVEAGLPVPTAWAEYRQHLRDVTDQPEFPYRVAFWPKPTL